MKLTSFQTFSYLTSHHHQSILNTDTNSWNLGKAGLFEEGCNSDEVLQVSVPSLLKTILILHQLCTFITLSIKIHSLVNSRVKSLIIMEPRSRDLNWISTGGSIRYRPRFFDQVGHQATYASIGNRHFFTTSCHRQIYQNFEQSRQKLGTFLENKVL